jgi:hypothetical protein
MTWRQNVTVNAECRQRVRFEERDGEGLATLDCTNDVASRQTIQVVGICALATHEHKQCRPHETRSRTLSPARLHHVAPNHWRHEAFWSSILCDSGSCIAGLVDRNLFMLTGGHVLQSRRPPPPFVKCYSMQAPLILVRIRRRLACTSNPASQL